jgi:hypothetical protein
MDWDRASFSRRFILAILTGLFGSLSAAAVAYLGLTRPIFQSDSASYIEWSPDRTPGYPFFISLVAAISPDYRILPVVQYTLLIAAAILLCDALASLLQSFWSGIALGLAIFVNLPLMRHPTGIMADSLFMTFIWAHAALVLYAARRGHWIWIALGGLTLSAAILVRPVGYAFLLALPWIVVLYREKRFRRGAIFATAALTPILLVCFGNLLARGYFGTQMLGGKNTLVSMEFLLPPKVSGFDPAVTLRAYEALAPLRQGVETAQGWERRTLAQYLTSSYEKLGVNVAVETVDADPAKWITPSPYWHDIAVDRLCDRLARTIILAEPLRFAGKVAHEFYGAWFLSAITTEANFVAVANGFGEFGRQNIEELGAVVKVVPLWAYLFKFVFFGAIMLSSLVLIGASVFWPSPALRGLAYTSASVHSYLLLIAGVGSAVPRYLAAIWPLQCAILIGAAAIAAGYWTRNGTALPSNIAPPPAAET